MEHKPPRHILMRILRILGKALLGLLFLLILLIALIHVPFVQNKVTIKVAEYLSTKLEARVDIESIRFSVLGDLTIKGIEVWDPGEEELIMVQEIRVASNLIGLLTGEYVFDEIYIDGLKGHLKESESGLNIQFILDAFGSDKQKDTTLNIVELQFTKLTLKDIIFAYSSPVSGIAIDVLLDTFYAENAEYTNELNKIKATKILMEHSVIQILSTTQKPEAGQSEVVLGEEVFTPDFGIGIGLEIEDLKITNSSFSLHADTIMDTPKFDPSHISMKEMNVDVSGMLMLTDTLVASLHSLSAVMPGFTLTDAKGEIQMSTDRLVLSEFNILSGSNEVTADITSVYDLSPTQGKRESNLTFSAKAHLDPKDFAYFLTDEVMSYFRQWTTTDIVLSGDYVQGSGELKQLELRSGNSFLSATGMFSDISDSEEIAWQDMKVQADIGSAFYETLKSFVGDLKVPPGISLQLVTSGDRQKIFLDGDVNTAWGDVTAKGMVAPIAGGLNMDLNLSGRQVHPSHWIDLPWLGAVDFSTEAKGMVGDRQDIKLNGLIRSVELMDQTIQDILFQTHLVKETVMADITIRDADYPAIIHTEVSFAGPIITATDIRMNDFKAGQLLRLDSSLIISGNFISALTIDQDSIVGFVYGDSLDIRTHSLDYEIDTLSLDALISSTASRIDYFSDQGSANVTANFDLRELPDTLQPWIKSMLKARTSIPPPPGTKTMAFDIHLDNAAPLLLLGLDVDDFSTLDIEGSWDQQQQNMLIIANSGRFEGLGISLDTLSTEFVALGDRMTATLSANNLTYSNFQLGRLDFDLTTSGDTAISNLNLTRDTISLLGLRTRIMSADSAIMLFPEELIIFDQAYALDRNNQVIVQSGNVIFDHFQLSHGRMELSLDGDLQAFDADFRNVDLTSFNPLIPSDSVVINHGLLTGVVSYIQDQALEVQAQIDSLVLYESIPFAVTMTASTKDRQVPFQFLLSNATNTVSMDGIYFLNNKEIDADVMIDVENLELFSFAVKDIFDEMKGSLKGEVKVLGPLQKPEVNGILRLLDARFLTASPQFTFHIADEKITLENSGITFDQFVMYDDDQHPLTINGFVRTKDYKSYNYDLLIKSDAYTLLNNAGTSGEQLTGLLILGADIALTGNDKETTVKADITIKDATDLTFLLARSDIDILDAEGIVVFVDPRTGDSTSVEQPASFYDSLITSLPDFNLNVVIQIENEASLQVITNAQSGDFIEASGGGRLELTSDRTGNPSLVGKYTLTDGLYRISFYDLVKKNFALVPGSSINWSGSPELGDLDIKAEYIVESNSIGLIGHEVGENEKANYKRALDYIVGITIKGTIENPAVSFSLDLSDADKASFPALANKLYRLRQPEFQSELNKQVFGLLVLGGFLPETTGADINTNQIATTALYNSVNSLLASQLNRFAGQYIKGVDIDVGFQSYSDFTTPGGKTQTAMDFRVSKSVLNDRLSFEVGGDFDITSDQSGGNTGDNYRGDVAIIYDLTGNGDKLLKLFNNETYDIIYQEIRNTGISLVFIREFDKGTRRKKKDK